MSIIFPKENISVAEIRSLNLFNVNKMISETRAGCLTMRELLERRFELSGY
jgi:hypothetical protein|tara:strand:+ start:1360 stop:1512 length:153 start_codon:yes stop_codon:yes gene_type:complete